MSSTKSWLVCLATAFLLGCGTSGGPEKIPVQGTVTYDGEPIPEGSISFHPQEGTKGAVSSGPIQNGEYKIDPRFGLQPGTYKIQILAFRPATERPKTTDREMPPAVSGINATEQYLPERFNTKSEIKPLTVSAGEKVVTSDHDLKSAGK